MADPHEERVDGATLKDRTVGRGWELFEPIDAAYDRGEIDLVEWHRRVGAIIGPAYMAAADPRGQSGSTGSAEEWELARRFIFAAVHRDGTFLDIGCANGHLMECGVAWLAETGFRIEPYGLEILPELAALARRRLPHWADRIAVGNALDWIPHPALRLRPDGVGVRAGAVAAAAGAAPAGGDGRARRTTDHWGAYRSGRQPAAVAGRGCKLGFHIAGTVEVPHARDYRVVRRAFWLERSDHRTLRASAHA
jgi:hypothetical protein